MPVDLSKIGLTGIETYNDTQLQQAQSRLADQSVVSAAIEDKKKEFELDQAQRLDSLGQFASDQLSRVPKGEGETLGVEGSDPRAEFDSLATPLEQVGEIYMRGGAPAQGAEFLTKASEIRKREADIKKGTIEAHGKYLDNVIKTSDVVSRTVGTAQSQEEWVAGIAQLREAGVLPPEAVDKLESIDYDPDVVAYLNEQALSAASRATLDANAQREERLKHQGESTEAYRLRMQNIAERRLEIAEQAQKRADKVGRSASSPSPSDVASAQAAIVSQIFEGNAPKKNDPALIAGSQSIAARARSLAKDNKALDWDTALNRAIEESKQAGDWKDLVNVQKFIGIPVNKEKIGKVFKTRGKTKEQAIPLPRIGNKPDGEVDTDKMVKGRYYLINGVPKKFTGN